MQSLDSPKLRTSKTSTDKISIEFVQKKLYEILLYHEVPEQDAEMTANILLEGTLRGYQNHGIERIFQILEGVEQGTIDMQATPSILKERAATMVMDGHFGLGYPLGKRAMDIAIMKAKECGMGAVGVINASHIGILGYYSEIASNQGCMGIVMSTSSPAVVVKGGKIKTFGTNPISYSLPFTSHPITADCATSKVSRGLVHEYYAKGQDIPLGWAVDNQGVDTHDAGEALNGGLKSFDGDFKGNIFSMLISILAGNLIGGVMNPKVVGTRDMSEKPNKGDFFMALDIESFTDVPHFESEIEDLYHFIKKQNVEFRIPGEQSHQKRNSQKWLSLSTKMKDLFNSYPSLNEEF